MLVGSKDLANVGTRFEIWAKRKDKKKWAQKSDSSAEVEDNHCTNTWNDKGVTGRAHEGACLTIRSSSRRYGFQGNFSCVTWQVVPSGQDSSILPARVANQRAGFDSSCLLAELAM